MRRAPLIQPPRRDPDTARPPDVESVPERERLAWASAVGSHAIQRLARQVADEEPVAEAEPYEPIQWLPEAEGGEEVLDDGAESEGEEAEPAAAVGRVLARQPTATRPRGKKGPRPTADDVADVKRVGTRVLKQVPILERERVITSLYAEHLTDMIEWFIDRARQRRSGERDSIRGDLRKLRKLPDQLRKQAAERRSTKGKTLISDFKVTPPVIRVGEGEAARISFVLGDKVKGVSAHIEFHEGRWIWMRTFHIAPTPGLHQAIWDGTFQGMASKPPTTGTYMLVLDVYGEKHTEKLYEQIRVENPGGDTVLPRGGSGHEVSTLHFDGKQLTLSDTGGASIESPATSGMKRHNPRNPEKKDYTDPQHQWVAGRGPIPAGTYSIKAGNYQVPDADRKGETYASGGTAAKWGPMRLRIEPNVVKNRSEFFIHMDVTNDGTAGCIGIPPDYEGKFNQMMSLIATSKKDIKLVVAY
jgi:hypothetical protein